MVHVVWWEEGGLVGTIEEPSGPVEGERVVDPVDDLGAPEEAIVASAEVFEEGTAVAPGNGDRSRLHPVYPTCRANALARLDDPGEAGETDPPDGPGHDLTVPATGSTSFTADAADGAVTAALFHEGERIAVADSAVDQPCEPVVDPADLDLVPVCYRPGEKKPDGSWGTPHGKFRVDNQGETAADVTWREDGGDQSGSLPVPAGDSAYFWVDLGAECAATVMLHYGGEQIDVKAANTVKRCQDEH